MRPFVHFGVLALAVFATSFTSTTARASGFDKWYTTHTIEKFPCMDTRETAFIKRIIEMQKIEQKLTLLTDHRKQVQPTPRRPASIQPEKLNNKNFICPPYKGVRNPYPAAVEFGKAAPFERVKITPSFMQIISGLNQNQQWPISYNPEKGYYEGHTAKGTPTNFIPVPADKGPVRFMVQYVLWQDKTPPSLTLCYREELHNQCNPYPNPAAAKSVPAKGSQRIPASAVKRAVSPAKS